MQDQRKFKLTPDLYVRTYSEIYADELAEALRTWHRIDRYESRIRSRMNTLHRLIYSIEGALDAIHGRTGR